MKRISFIFLLFGFCGIGFIYTEPEILLSQEQLSSFNKPESAVAQKSADFQLRVVDAGRSDHNPFIVHPISHVYSKEVGVSNDHSYSKKRKRGRKGLLPALICIINESCLIIPTFEAGLTYSYKIFYRFYLHFTHGERGPPFTI